jgi:glucose-1-phosphate thymidylyltransferase
VDEVVVAVGVMHEMVVDYVSEEYGPVLEVEFVEQALIEGLGHSVYQARDAVDDESMCIALGDMLFDSDYGDFLTAHENLGDVDGSIGVKRVDEPSNYGIISTDGDRITDLEEKPNDPDSDLAISGFYVIEDAVHLFDAIEYFIANDIRGAGDEYQLTDALGRMLGEGAEFGTFDVGDWYDCGRPETLLEANRVTLERLGHGESTEKDSSVIVPPVDIGDDVTLERSVVGPHVSIDDSASVTDSRISDAIVGRGATVEGANLKSSIVGDYATVTGTPDELNVGDSSDIHL